MMSINYLNEDLLLWINKYYKKKFIYNDLLYFIKFKYNNFCYYITNTTITKTGKFIEIKHKNGKNIIVKNNIRYENNIQKNKEYNSSSYKIRKIYYFINNKIDYIELFNDLLIYNQLRKKIIYNYIKYNMIKIIYKNNFYLYDYHIKLNYITNYKLII